MATDNITFSSINDASIENVVARIGNFQGDVLIVRATGDLVRAQQGDVIFQQDTIVTARNSSALLYADDDNVLTLGHSAKLQFTPSFTETIQENFQHGSFDVGEKVTNISELIQDLIDAENLEEGLLVTSAGNSQDKTIESSPVDNTTGTSVFSERELIQWLRINNELVPVNNFNALDASEFDDFFREQSNLSSIAQKSTDAVVANSAGDEVVESDPEAEEPTNNAPTAVDDTFQAEINATFDGNVLTNDNDPDGDTLTTSTVSGVSNGVLTLNADGTFTYTPNADFNGTDSFVYEISDGKGGTDQATATITVDNPTSTIMGTGGYDNLIGSAGVDDDIYTGGGVGFGVENVQGVEGTISEAQVGHEGSGNDRLIFTATDTYSDDAKAGSGHIRIRDFTVGDVTTDVDADTLVLGDFLRAGDATFDGTAEDALRFLHFVDVYGSNGKLLYIDVTGSLGDGDSAARNTSEGIYSGIDGGASILLEFKGTAFDATPAGETINTVEHIQMLMDNGFLDFS